MKKTLSAIVVLVILIFICTSGLIEPITKVFVWLITLQFNSPDISVFGQLVAKYGTWIITYSLVGMLFNALGWFDSSAMKIVYFIISTIISLLLSWLIMVLEKYLWIITIVVGCLVLVVAGVIITLLIIKKKKSQEVTDNA
ncbi:MAG: hypothetical protein IJ706_09015 [Clostridia bacterium]|nr:hypothetical protein [Clostridia bacterium]